MKADVHNLKILRSKTENNPKQNWKHFFTFQVVRKWRRSFSQKEAAEYLHLKKKPTKNPGPNAFII